jgi:hypothetical protein
MMGAALRHISILPTIGDPRQDRYLRRREQKLMKNKAIYATERVGVNGGNRFSQVGLFGIHSSDRAMNHKVWDGDEWLPSKTDWLSLGGAFDSIPAATVVDLPSFTALPYLIFGLGTDDQAYQARVVPNVPSQWPPSFQDWQPIGGVFKSPLIVQWWGVVLGGQVNEVSDNGWALIGLGTENQPYLKARNPTDGSTTDWQPLGGRLIYEPAIAYSDPANTFDIFGVGTDAQMYHMVFDGSQWPPTTTAWEPLGGCFTSAPAAVKWSSNRIDIFGLGRDTQMYHKWWDGVAWGPSPSDWEALGGLFDSSPAAVSLGANRLDIFALGTDDQMYHKWWDGAAWGPSPTDWEALGGQFVSAPAVSANVVPARLDIFGIGTDTQMYHKWQVGGAWMPSPTDWESIGGSFLIPRPTQMPARLDFDTSLVFPDGIAVGGSAHVTLSKDGSSEFSGHLHDSGGLSYNCLVGCVVKDSKNRAYIFTQSGSVKGTFEAGSRDFDWNDGGDPNPAIVANWNDLFGCGGAQVTFVANVNLDTANLLADVLTGVTAVIGVISK